MSAVGMNQLGVEVFAQGSVGGLVQDEGWTGLTGDLQLWYPYPPSCLLPCVVY